MLGATIVANATLLSFPRTIAAEIESGDTFHCATHSTTIDFGS